MGRIKKIASERHTATASPFVTTFVKDATSTPLNALPSKLDSFPQEWPFPRGDLYHWIPLLDRFDHLLELFNKEYALDKGPQEQPFECRLLRRGDAEAEMPYPSVTAGLEELKASGFSDEGDRELVEAVLQFTRVLLEHCGNRSLYASSGHLNDLLHTSSLSLLRQCLKLSLRLAQRYYVARSKNSMPHAQAVLLAHHYNIDMERLNKIAQPFPKVPQPMMGASGTPAKGKERATSASFNPCDLVKIAKDPSAIPAKGELASIYLTYYEPSSSTSRPDSSHTASASAPNTPTPARRTSNLGPSRDRSSAEERSTAVVEPVATPIKSRETDDSSSSSPKTYQVPATQVATTPTWTVVRSALQQVPQESAYDLLNRARIAKAFSDPSGNVQQLLEVRLLAISNLAYAMRETGFLEKIGTPDTEEPKQFHLAQQLCDLLQPPSEGQDVLSLDLEIAVLTTLEAMSKSRHKAPEVSDALQVTHNHGVLYFELRKVIATLHVQQHEDKAVELRENEWRESTFDLTNALLQSNLSARQGERMVNAGLMAILVEALNLRTARAEYYHERILQFFDSFIHGIPTAFQTLTTIKGFDTLVDLTSYEVSNSLTNVQNGEGLPADYKSRVVDYSISFIQQSTLRTLFKFMVHMYEHNAGTHDRLLRNLIDTPQILGSLRTVIENAQIFGANVWIGAVNILSSFIHNEPTSFQVVNEAGLVQSLLQTIVPWDLNEVGDDSTDLTSMPIGLDYEDGKLVFPTPKGILPANDTMCDIPSAFGAICLNESGMKLFQNSKALYKFMDIFVSPPHVRALEEDSHVATAIGQAFDELSRHHPQLKDQIIWVVIAMVKRVGEVCQYHAARNGVGAKLWHNTESDIAVAGGRDALAGSTPDVSAPQSSEEGTVTAPELGETAKDRADGVPYLTACFKFLEGFFHNATMCSQFCEQGGAIYLLNLATSASNPADLVAFPVFRLITQVIKTMCDAKPHLVLPSLIRRTQNAVAVLKPLVENRDPSGVFAPFLSLSSSQSPDIAGQNGTTIVKSLATMHILTYLLSSAYSPPSYVSRNNQVNLLFASLNFTEVYLELVSDVSALHSALLWESLALQKSIPEPWKQATEPKPFPMRRVDANGYVEYLPENKHHDSQNKGDDSNKSATIWDDEKPEEGLAVKNAKTVRYLLSQTPRGIQNFFHQIGQAMATKRNTDLSTKQHSSLVADQLASRLVVEIDYRKFETTDPLLEVRYLAQVMSSTSHLLVKPASSMESSYPHKEALSLVLSKFYLNDGFAKFNECLRRFVGIVAEAADSQESNEADSGVVYAREGAINILGFYNQVVRHKCINDAVQSTLISVKDHRQPDFFLPQQLLLEIRSAVLPAISELWNSSSLMTLGEHPAKHVVEILRVILGAEGEERGVLRRNDKAIRRTHAQRPGFTFQNSLGLSDLEAAGFDTELVKEGLYRTNNNIPHAREYCNLRKICPAAPAFPVRTAEAAEQDENATAGEAGERRQSVDMADASVLVPVADAEAEQQQPNVQLPGFSHLLESIDADAGGVDDDIFAAERTLGGFESLPAPLANGSTIGGASSSKPTKEVEGKPFVFLEDLDEKRAELRENLIERCLEILSHQTNITFELSDLILTAFAAYAREGEHSNSRADIGSTLVTSLLSLQGGPTSEASGAKISAYAHLVGLVLQNRDFFDATLPELKNYFEPLINWVDLEGDQKIEDAPWIGTILLIVERVLAEDEQPAVVEWNPPTDPEDVQPAPEVSEPAVDAEARTTLFDSLVNLLPKIGKNASLGLSVSRVLAILTRRRDMALRLSDKQNIGKLFVMFRQLAENFNDKIHSMFIIILRHMVEDKATIRQIMETEIRHVFETSNRSIDTQAYTRSMCHLVLRDPETFVEVTQDLLEISRFENPSRALQHLVLKKDKQQSNTETSAADPSAAQPEQNTAEGSSSDQQKPAEVKPPTVETTDGVIQFLLRELFAWRNVEDTPPSTGADRQSETQNGSSDDVEMTDDSASASANTAESSSSNSKPEKQTFKPEEHGAFRYRCFLLQCLSELLASYNKTKIEFINFNPRKAEVQISSTPSRPRASQLSYLLNGLLPVGTLEQKEDLNLSKKVSTSSHASSVLVSLCSKTPEKSRGHASAEEADLTFVRKFVLEHGLRALKDVSVSSEPLDQRYSRVLALSDLFNSMLQAEAASLPHHVSTSARQMGRLMYEKNFVVAFTTAIAEIDLNFPNAKRAVRSILSPLKQLTDLGVELSQDPNFSSSSTSGSADEEEIASTTSVSEDEDDEDDREQTPDLYRNSTLGMFESRGTHDEEDSESDSEDEDDDEAMYDEYGEEMEFDEEEEEIPDHGEVISDDDDEDLDLDDDQMGDIEGRPGDMGVDVEIVMEDGDEDESGSDEDDEEDEDDGEDDEDDPDEYDVDEMMEEITGDDENASLNEGMNEEDWEEDEGAHYDDDDVDDEEAQDRDDFAANIANLVGEAGTLDMEMDHRGAIIQIGDQEFMEDDQGPDDEEEDDEDENGVVYEPDLEDDDDDDDQDIQYEWEAPPPPRPSHHHHHHHRHALPDMFGMPGGDNFRPMFRNYPPRPTSTMGRDDGTNPLLRRHGTPDGASQNRDAYVDMRISRSQRRPVIPREIQEIVNSMNHGGGHGNLAVSVNGQMFNEIAPPLLSMGTRPLGLLDLDRGGSPRTAFYVNPDQMGADQMGRGGDLRRRGHGGADDSGDPARLASTMLRWQDEAKMLFGGKHLEKASRIVHALLRLLIPPAMEAKKERDKAEAEMKAAEEKAREEQRKKEEEEQRKKEEEERLAREAREREERELEEARQAEETRLREEAERAASTAAAAEGEGTAEEPETETSNMEGVQASQQAQNESSAQEPAEPAERLTITIRGREVDITDLGIDREYIEALPEEYREDVIMGQIAENRRTRPSQPAPVEQEATGINPDFLNALPEEMQQELLRSEARERRIAAAREENRRAAEAGNAPAPEAQEMSNADLFAMLEGQLRAEVLRDADPEMLASLPEEIQAEARNLNGAHRFPRDIGRLGGVLDGDNHHIRRVIRNNAPGAAAEANRSRRPVMQMLDKAGVATLMRLMFVSLHHKAKSYLHGILSDVCKNTQGRAEVISILLSILQDGTADVSAVERSFAHLSLRAKQQAGTKTPQPLKRTITGGQVTPGAELSPLNIVQQCLGTLNALSSDNPRVPSFFLSEHEMQSSQKNKPSKKGKGRETKASKFPLNALLTLLDRALITENIGVMETLASLLSRVTHPLNILLKRRKTAEESEQAQNASGDDSADANAQGGTASDVPMGEATNGEGAQQSTSAGENTESADAPATEQKDEDEQETSGAESKKKNRDLVPPEVPEENLRLVVNIISARECPGRTFSDTLDVIRNLSAIPGAKLVFGKELVRQAQELAQTVSGELEELAPQIDDASTGTDLQGVALAKFASTGARQNKLLRVLVALDYLFDPKRVPHTEESADSSGEPQLKVDILASLYESSTFDKLWSNLSLSLTAIRNRGNMVNVAATLLPAIESLMVVCKNATVQDAPVDPTTPLAMPAAPKAGAHMETLFFSFTEDNRKILNELIRSSPKLMNGNLAVMAKNSKVLEFDNKRAYFTRRLHNRGTDFRASHPVLQLNVRRDNVLLDSYKSLGFKKGDEIKYGKFNIRFIGEEGIDAGGVSREWFAAMARQMFNPNYALFNPVASDRTTFHPNPFSEINPEHLFYFKFIGRIIGKALYEGRVLDCHFSRAVYRRILGKTVSLKDMESLDLDYYKSLVWILENDITDITFETFSVDVDHFGVVETHDLIEDGRNVPVTQENKHDYVQKVVEHRLIKSVEKQLTEFLTGFHDIIPRELIAIFNEQELELLISGLPEIDVDDWKNNTEYHNYQPTSPQIQWFWRAVRSFDKEEKAKLLQFITGTSKVPLNGFKELEGMNGFAKFNIHRDYSSKEKLPSSHTCFNQLDLPEYESYEHLRQQLYTAITAGSEYFGFA